MTALSAFAITQKWPAQHRERPQLDSLPTPNGVKVSIMREEIGLPYEAHRVSFGNFPHVQHVLQALVARPAVLAGLLTPKAAA